ncbi:1-acyl-sn-glycerol-3-phosphate acyltransferase [Parabacteroides pacaensis]|uniref:1-acyl-sn-glycerol-3-phosphate acyltransferase n=1 Tax=Parabacteroides pacaensis TaxID=2086575 RepID=UPI000D0FC1A1|nr:1-acyl-sn-glycerol-3-phosphate acyltransferase [Parabacteroides pacaensis]
MDAEIVSNKFDDIRPLNNNEVKGAIESLVINPEFKHALMYIMPDINWDEFVRQMLSFQTKEEFKSVMARMAVNAIAKRSTFSLDISGRSRLTPGECYTFISNHRDIVLDASFLNMMLYQVGYGMTQVAIGDNLLIRPWIETLVRLNNSVIVKRGLSGRQMLEASATLSAYIHHTITETKESIWIAQREGRAKDSDDRTQASVLKMLNMGGEKDFLSNIMELNIAPVSITYEYDPCDYLKAKEFQQKRDDANFVKTPHDDLLNMETGILGNHGRVHFTLGTPINKTLAQLDKETDKATLINTVASIIDKEIFLHYRFYPGNYVAYDWLTDTNRFADAYSAKDQVLFREYIQQQLDKIELPNKDETFLRTKLLEMYANPLKNYLSVK